jgi:hypothetical protein
MSISAKIQRIIHEVEALNQDERNELMCALEAPASISISPEWREKIDRRAREIDEGTVKLIAEEDFLSKLRAV